MSTKYRFADKDGVYFTTSTVVGWADVFTRKEYKEILLDSIRHCQKEKGFILHSWCLRSNHVHLVISVKEHNPSDILRDFKKYTSKQIIKAITEHPAESRKEWMLHLFKKAGETNSRNASYQFWRQDSQPKELYNERFTSQKLDYMHNNPVEAGIVEKQKNICTAVRRVITMGKIMCC